MNWTAKVYFNKAVSDAISRIEKSMETNSKLLAEGRLVPNAEEYFKSQIVEQKEAIGQLREFMGTK